jgi:hypothetical protein
MFPLPDYAVRPVAVAIAGGGLILVGLANLLVVRPGPRARAIGSLLAAAAYVAAIRVCFDAAAVAVTTGMILSGSLLVCLVAGSAACRLAAARVATAAVRPSARWGMVTAAGLLFLVGGFGSFDAADERRIDNDMTMLKESTENLEVTIGARLSAMTDRGENVEVCVPTEVRDPKTAASIEENYLRHTPHIRNIICRQPADDSTNCHGWVFTGGRFILGGGMVDRILADNGYGAIDEPRPGDLVVYRGDNQQVLHSGIVRYVTPGMPILVEGKWGGLGVFLHPVDKSCYGTTYSYYRSPRAGHLLASLPAAPAVTQAQITGAE